MEKRRKLSTDEEPGGRQWTLSIAVPGSVIDNTQTVEQATAIAGQIARAAAIFNVDEVVVFDDSGTGSSSSVTSGTAFLARVLQFMETPQYLRKALLPMHKDLRQAGALPPLDAPHHMRAAEWGAFREGVVLCSVPGVGSLVDVGLDRSAFLPVAARTKMRVTLHMGDSPSEQELNQPALATKPERVLAAELALPQTPREERGLYWGYMTRIAHSLEQVLQGSSFQEGYDLTVGTSERGRVVEGGKRPIRRAFKHLLVCFGGPSGLEAAWTAERGEGQVEALFDDWINTCPSQGSRTIRTEEALLISLSSMQHSIQKHGST